jgi:hypothetical protein
LSGGSIKFRAGGDDGGQDQAVARITGERRIPLHAFGGYVTGASRAISEPLLAMGEQEIEDLIGLDAYYRIEEETVERIA